MIAAPPSAFGSMMASGFAGAIASRSASVSPVCSPFTRTIKYGRCAFDIAFFRKAAADSRARALPSKAIESSRSTISASAPLDIALSSLRALSAGTNKSERMWVSPLRHSGAAPRRPLLCATNTSAGIVDSGLALSAPRNDSSLRPQAHEGLAAALGDELVVLVIGAVMKFDDAGAGPRLRFALANNLGRAMHGVAFEQGVREFDVGHAEIGDGGADRHVGNLDADHQPERKQRVHQRLAPFGLLLAEMPVDMERLRIERHVGKQHVVHLRDGAGIAVLDDFAGDEILEIEAAALVPRRCLLRHTMPPWGFGDSGPFSADT